MWIHCLLCTHVEECRNENYYYNSTNFTFCQGQEHKTTTFLFFSWTFWYSPLEFNSRKIHQHLTIVWDGISAINFEAAQIRSLLKWWFCSHRPFIFQDLFINKSWLGPTKTTMIAQKRIRSSFSKSDQTLPSTQSKHHINKPSYLTEAWLPEVEELLDDKGVGLSVNDRFGFDAGNGSVCVWYCWLMSRLAPLGESRCSVWLYLIDDSLDTVWLDALGGGAGMCLGLPVEWCHKTEQHNQTLPY